MPARSTPRETLAAMDRLAAIVAEWYPAHGAQREPLELERDAPRLLRELWRRVGFSPELQRSPLFPAPPLRAACRERAAAKLAEWFEDARVRDRWDVSDETDEAVQQALGRLPRRFRAIAVGTYHIRLADESSAADDPPLLVVYDARPKPQLLGVACVHHTIHDLLYAAAGQRRVTVGGKIRIKSERPLAPLFSALRELGEGVWLVDGLRLKDGSFRPEWMCFRTVTEYTAFALAQPDDQIGAFTLPRGHMIEVQEGALSLRRSAPPGFRRFLAGNTGTTRVNRAAGFVDGMPVWLDGGLPRYKKVDVRVEPQHRAQAKAWLKTLGAKILGEYDPYFHRAPAGAYAWDYCDPRVD
jgi:hypothetical protein